MPWSDEGEEALFTAALEQPLLERAAVLDRACHGKPALRQRLQALLAAHAKPDPNLAIVEDQALGRARPGPCNELADAAVGQRMGRYKLLEKIGEGGCGVVYVAEQTEPVRRGVAIKIIKVGMDTKAVVARFEAERQALAMMEHPNIAKVLDAGTTENAPGGARVEGGSQVPAGRPYFVMELVRGVRITDYCDEQQLSTHERLELFIKVCQAIQHAHQKGIIHRDIKPSNILVTLHDGVPVPKVIDFGIAKAIEGRLTDGTVYTELHHFIGTPAYMSPEQAQLSALDVDTRSDIYSLGVLLYELLTGKTPFDAQELLASGIDAMRKTIREKEPVRPSTRLTRALAAAAVTGRTAVDPEPSASSPRRLQELIHLLKGDLDWIVMKCLEKDRTRRYETANGLAADIKRHLVNEPVVARPPSARYQFQKALRRNRAAFTAGAVVAAALLTGTLVSTWQVFETRKARNAEKEQRLAAQAAQKRAEGARAAEKQERLRADAEKLVAQRHLYAANMNLAQQAWEQPNILRLRQLLEETQNSPFRGFEWSFWQRQSHLATRTLRGHLRGVTAAAFSRNGQWIVTGSQDHTAKVWEAATGRELLTLTGHSARIWSVAFSPDNQRIATGSDDQSARVWEAATGRELLTLTGPHGRIYALAFSPDGRQVVTGGRDHTARVWDAATGRELLQLQGHTATIYAVAFSPDGQRMVTASKDRTARIWDAATGRELLALPGHHDAVLAAAFSPDGQRLVTGSQDQTAKIWEAANGRELLTLKWHTGFVSALAFSPDGQRIATGSDDQTARIWETATGRELLTLKGHSAPIIAVAFSPDGQRIVTGSDDQTAKVWEAAIDRERLAFRGHSAPIWAVAFSPDGQWIATGGEDQTARLWDAATGRERLTLKGHQGILRSLVISPDGQRILTSGGDQTVRLWDVATGRELFKLQGHSAVVISVAYSPDGQRMVTGSEDQTAKVWDAANGRELLTLQGHRNSIRAVAYSPDGQRIVTGSEDQTAKVWDAANGQELLTLHGHRNSIRAVAYSPDGQRIATGSADHMAILWDAASGTKQLALEGHSDQISALAFSPDGQRIITGSADQTARLWEAASGRELLTFKGHKSRILSVAYSPGGQRIATGSSDHTAKVWQAARAEEIAAWQVEEQEAARYLAALRRQQSAEEARQRLARAEDQGAIKQWRILAPIPLSAGQTGAQALYTEQIQGESWLQPAAGEMRAIGGQELNWADVALDDHVINLNAFVGRETLRSVAYAVCFLRSETEQRALRILIGSDDRAALYLNGQQVYRAPFHHPSNEDEDAVPNITLNAGLNLLVFKLVNEFGLWQGSIRFTDAQGNPVQGIQVTLEPSAKALP